MTNGDQDSDCEEDGEIWEEEGGYLVISADKVISQFFGGCWGDTAFPEKSKA